VASLRPVSEVRTRTPQPVNRLPTAAPMAPGAMMATVGLTRATITSFARDAKRRVGNRYSGCYGFRVLALGALPSPLSAPH